MRLSQGAVLFLDENGNPVRIDSTWYSSHYSALEIDFDAFELIGQSRSIANADAVDVAEVNGIATATINIFPFLDQVHSNITAGTEEPISFAFLFTFATPVDQSTVDIDDFNISLVESSGSSTRLDSNNDNITFTFTDYSTGGEASSTFRYDLVETAQDNISFNTDSTIITMSFPLSDDMLYYGFDIENQLAVALDPDNDIASASGILLGSGSEPLAYIVQAQMPLLTEFLFVDPTTEVASPDDASVNQYSTFDYSLPQVADTSFEHYYGFRLRYGFHEPIAAVQGRSSTTSYYAPEDSYYLEGAGTDLLAYQKYAPFGSADLPTSGTIYDTFFVDGSLVHPDLNDPDANTTWDHLVYLSDDETQFESDTAEHNFTILASESNDYMVGSGISAYAGHLPALLGGYDTSGGTVYSPDTKLEANFFLDAYGNPARVADIWLPLQIAEANSTLAITYDRSKPSLLSAQALETIDTDADGNADTFDGYFGRYSDEVTFEFALTFDREMDEFSLESGIRWDVDTNSTALGTPTQSVSTGTPDGTNYIYTFSYSVEEGLYAAGGTYAITFDTSETVTDTKGNELELAPANTTLESNLCLAGTCQFINNPVTLASITVDPGGIVVIGVDSTDAAAFNITLSFTEPVALNATNTADEIFDLTYTLLEDGSELEPTSNLESTIISFGPVAASEDGSSGHYSEYELVITDTNEQYWATTSYVGEPSVVSIFFADDIGVLNTSTLSPITFAVDFSAADGALATLPASVQSGYVSDGADATAMQYLISNIMPVLTSASPAAADSSNSQNQNPATPVARHVEFNFEDNGEATLLQAYGSSVGMLMLYRTEDNEFTHTDTNTAPFYGADGGVLLSGADLNANNIGHHVCPPFSDHIHGHQAGISSRNAGLSYNSNRMKIHYLAIPYYPNNSQPIVDADYIAANISPITVDFSTSADHLSDTEPCVRSTFYNQGKGQYGYIVDTDRDEEMMLIANAVLQDADGYDLDSARLPTSDHNNVYFDLYTRDYYNDSWQVDETITLAQVLADLKTSIGDPTLHSVSASIAISFASIDGDAADETIFASRFINTINARFLNNVFREGISVDSIEGYGKSLNQQLDEVEAAYAEHVAEVETSVNFKTFDKDNDYSSVQLPHEYLAPSDTSTATIAPTNQNRLVLSVGVHPAAITVNPGGGDFTPFATDPAQLLEMHSAFYGLHYGGVASTTKPAFDYTSRHLAYVNFDLVYQLTRDSDTGAITSYSLEEIISPFTLLKNELFTGTTLTSMRDNGEVYSAAAASIADNVFRHNFLGSNTSDGIGHYLPVGVYCRTSSSSPSDSACRNDFAQMLLPDPDDGTLHERTIVSDHYLHRHVLRLDPENYSVLDTTENGGYDLLGNLVQLTDAREDSRRPNNGNSGKVIDQRSYSSIIYNSFDRDYALSYNDSSRSFTSRSMDGKYDGDFADNATSVEQSFFGLSPFAESPNSRADQILPNAFLLGNQIINYGFHFFAKPYQHSGYTADIKNYLGSGGSHNGIYDDLRFISSHLYTLNGVQTNIDYDDGGTYYKVSTGHFLPTIWEYALPAMSGSDFQAFSAAAGPRTNLYDYYMSASFDNYVPMAHISPTHPSHYNITNYLGGIRNQQNSNPYTSVSVAMPSLFAGRLPGMATDTTGANEYEHDYAESLHPALATGPNTTNLTLARTQHDWTLASSSSPDGLYLPDTRDIKLEQMYYINYGHGSGLNYPSPLYAFDSTSYSQNVDTLSDSFFNDGRLLTPGDDYDFDRGQTLSRKLGFFLNEGIVFADDGIEKDTSYDYYVPFNNIFFPTALDTDVGVLSPITEDYDSPLVENYYPLVQASETLYTSSTALPTIVVAYKNGSRLENAFGPYTKANTSSGNLQNSGYMRQYSRSAFSFGEISSDSPQTSIDATSKSGAIYHHIPLDKIFPAGYSYQLGFINREELFMYDPASGNGDNADTPQILRFSEAGVGSFGYATQYNRLNRRSMIQIHQGTSSHFLGDHLARFQGTPSAGVHVSNDIDNPYAHTPANQGATGTNYGSYGEGHYDLTTGDEFVDDGTWKHRTYSGTLRGHVVEMRMNPIYTSPAYQINPNVSDTADINNGDSYIVNTDFTDLTSNR